MKLYDYLLVLGLVGTTSYVFLFKWMPHSQYETFSMLGATFFILFSTMMIKIFIVTTAITFEWVLPRISKKFKNVSIVQPSFNFFNKRIEIRIVDRHNMHGKVTF